MAQWVMLMCFLLLNLEMLESTTIMLGNYPSVSYPKSCKELLHLYGCLPDGLYFLSTSSGTSYLTFCDMTTDGGGWTLVASIHENNMYGKCTVGDRWSSQQGNNENVPEGDGNWSNKVTFGTVEAASSDDFKNPGYYEIIAEDMSVWHVPNGANVDNWKPSSIFRYHTQKNFLTQYGGNLYNLYKAYPVRYNAGVCHTNTGPSIPIVYDFGNDESLSTLYGPNSKREYEPGYITFRAFNNEKAALALCSGLKPKGCNIEHFCIGGGGFFAEGSGRQCGDFAGFDWNGYGTHSQWSASKEMTESVVMLFYR
ncbi:intelectin-1a-like [Arapaima gigas]